MWASTSAEGGKPGKGRRPKIWQKKTARERSAAPSKCARGGLCNGIAWMHGAFDMCVARDAVRQQTPHLEPMVGKTKKKKKKSDGLQHGASHSSILLPRASVQDAVVALMRLHNTIVDLAGPCISIKMLIYFFFVVVVAEALAMVEWPKLHRLFNS